MATAQTMAGRVREYISSISGEFKPISVVAALEMDAQAVRKTLVDMLKRGEVERTAYGKYRFLEYKPLTGQGNITVRPKIYRAIHVKGGFTTGDIAKLADADRDYVRRIVNQLVREGDIERLSLIRRQRSRQNEWSYRVRHKDRFFLKYVRGER